MQAESEKGLSAAQAHRLRTLVSALVIFILIPLAIFIGIKFFGDRRYLFISLAIIVLTSTPFFLIFEARKPMASEIVMIGVMSALTVCAHMACFMTQPFQAGTALVIITGIAFGPEAGFLTGALARFVTNFFSGQGPWTPWQMFSWGILGFISGVVFNKASPDKPKSRDFKIILGPVAGVGAGIGAAYLWHLVFGHGAFPLWQLYAFGAAGLAGGMAVQRRRLPIDDVTLSVYGFLVTFIVYGGIMNFSAMILSSAIPSSGVTISLKSLAALYATGVPYDAVHAAGSAFFLFLFGEKLIRKMERVKIKYGLYD